MNPQPTPAEPLWLERTKALGLVDDAHALQAIVATLHALGECLPSPERTALTDALPARLARHVAPYKGAYDVEQFFARVRASEGTTTGFAREHAEVVCRMLREVLPEEVTFRVGRALPASVTRVLWAAPERVGEPPPYRVAHDAHHHTLATGAPGSTHPVSNAPPPGAQSESVVRAENPHGTSKVSSAAGLTQEQTQESLATDTPDTTRTISSRHN